jgi:recombination associated protein RdgC
MAALIDSIEQKSFLGAEFATWLWFRSETGGGTVDLGEGKSCFIDFEKDLVLTSDAGEALASALRGEAPSLAPEATAALLAGKKVQRAKIRITLDGAPWEMTLDAERFDWRGLKIDTPPTLPFDEAVALRLAALEEFHGLFDRLFSRFLNARLDSDAWEAEADGMRRWILGRSQTPPTGAGR